MLELLKVKFNHPSKWLVNELLDLDVKKPKIEDIFIIGEILHYTILT